MRDLHRDLPYHLYYLTYMCHHKKESADDTSVIATGQTIDAAQRNMDISLQDIQGYAYKLKIKLNEATTEAMLVKGKWPSSPTTQSTTTE